MSKQPYTPPRLTRLRPPWLPRHLLHWLWDVHRAGGSAWRAAAILLGESLSWWRRRLNCWRDRHGAAWYADDTRAHCPTCRRRVWWSGKYWRGSVIPERGRL